MQHGQKENIENNKEQEKRPREKNTPQHASPKEYSNNRQPGTDIFKNNIWGGH